MKTTKQTLLTIIICLAILAGVNLVYSAWNPPTKAPTEGNTPEPINVGDTSQIKSGALQVNGFRNLGSSIFDGSVGIGTTESTEELHIKNKFGSTDTELVFEYDGVAGGIAKNYSIMANENFTIRDRIANIARLTISADGRVGIGTANPSAKLDVAGGIKATSDICTDAGGGKCLSNAGGGGGTMGQNSCYWTGEMGAGGWGDRVCLIGYYMAGAAYTCCTGGADGRMKIYCCKP